MNKKNFLTIGITPILIVLIATIVAATVVVFFSYPYNPKLPPRANDTGFSPEGIKEVVNANNKFAFDLYSELDKSEEGNILYSPYSIFAAFAITYEGARGKTAEEIKSVFHFPEMEILRPNFAAIYNDIKGYKDYELIFGNALWVQQDYPLLKDYTNRVEEYYGGKAANLNFVGETEKSRQTINSFIEEQTKGKIKELLPQGILSENTVLVITNAIYFKGTWVWQFDPKDTREMNFKINRTHTVKVPMMHMESRKSKFNYVDLEELQILELPYKGDKISMLILLPEQGYTLEDIELSAEKLSEYKSRMKETEVEIYLPKFELSTKYFMKETLMAMGIITAFKPHYADFSGMDGTKNLFIANLIHQTYVKVDETGTEAAATAAVPVMRESIGNVFIADHPFIFIIQQKDTGNILFMGRVVDPTNK